MPIYADLWPRRARQVAADLLVLGWCLLWVRVALEVHEQVQRLATPGRSLEAAGTDLSSAFTRAGDRVGEVPLLGDPLQAPFSGAAEAARALAGAGRSQQEAVGELALLLALLVAVLPVAWALGRWLPARLAWARDAGATRRLLNSPDGAEVLAVRALSRSDLSRLAALPPGVVAGWRRGDPEATRRLAAVEAESLGLAPPS